MSRHDPRLYDFRYLFVMEHDPHLSVRFASSAADLRACHRLRYDVFVKELGGGGEGVDHALCTETDRFDPHCRHLVLVDDRRAPQEARHVVGVYRLMTIKGARDAGRFYCANEFDLSPLLGSDRSVLELGRSCVHPDFRGGAAMYLMWQALARYVLAQRIDLLFGVASFHGTDAEALAQPLSFLHRNHLAPVDLRAHAVTQDALQMDILPADAVDRKTALLAMPALIKAYLRMGGFVGEGAFVDREFNTTDVLMVLDTARINDRQRRIYASTA